MNQSQNLLQDMCQFPELQMMCKGTLYYVSGESTCLLCLTKQEKTALIEQTYKYIIHALILD